MRVIVCENYEEMSKVAANMVAGQLLLKPESVLGLATGSTPIGMYEELVRMNKAGEADFSKAKSFNLDEYYPLAPDNDQSYHYFMNEHLFSKVNIKPENINIPDGTAKDVQAECDSYEQRIAQAGGIDLQILGIGNNGHIGFNEPEEALHSRTHLTDLTEDTIEANARFFASRDEVPRQALTMGMASIMGARKILLLISGKGKHAPLKAVLSGKITTSVPASLLNLHADTVAITDRAAYEG